MRAFILVIFILFSHLLIAQNQKGFVTKVGDQSPSYELVTLDGTTVTPVTYHGKVLLICMFGTHCPPCLRELPEVKEKLYDALPKNKFELLAVSIVDTPEMIQRFEDKKGYDFTYASDKDGWTNFRLFADSSLPRSIVINQEGKIIYQAYGYNPMDFKEMEILIKKTIK